MVFWEFPKNIELFFETHIHLYILVANRRKDIIVFIEIVYPEKLKSQTSFYLLELKAMENGI
jgi:hypothetical protein